MRRLVLPAQVKLELVLIIVRLSGGGDTIVRSIHVDEMRRSCGAIEWAATPLTEKSPADSIASHEPHDAVRSC
jgi:hypothetical protein